MKVKYAILYVLMLFLMVGCTSSSTEKEALVSVTIEPQRYFVEKIGGADFTVNCVIPSGQSPETYDPEADDADRAKSCLSSDRLYRF